MDIRELIEKSGNNFHYKVVSFLRNQGWSVLVAPYYNDVLGNKSREIDIVAEKQFEIREPRGVKGILLVRFFVECKYINQETVFWFDSKDMERAKKKICMETGLSDGNQKIKTHHYFIDDRVVKLFESNKKQENDPIYTAITQVLNASIYFKNNSPIIPNFRGNVLKSLEYPLIVCNDFNNFFKSDETKIQDNFQLEVNYAYLDKSKAPVNNYFIIDVIDFNKLSNFLSHLENTDISLMREILFFE